MEDDDEELARALAAMEREHAGDEAAEIETTKLRMARGLRTALPYESLSMRNSGVRAESITSAKAALEAAEATCTPESFELARRRILAVFIDHGRLRRDHETALARGDAALATRLSEELRMVEETRTAFMARLGALHR